LKTDELTPKQRALRQRIASLSGRIGATARTMKEGYDGKEAMRPATEAYWLKLEAECDPRHELGADERRAKAKKLWQTRMLAGQLKRAQKALKKAG
jgi:hypothetical protein